MLREPTNTMKLPETLTVTVKAIRNRFHKTTGQYRASIAGIEASGYSKEQAIECLGERIENMARYAYTRVYKVTPGGVMFALHHTAGAWIYDIVHQDGKFSSCMMEDSGELKAREAMEQHFAQYVASEPFTQPAQQTSAA